MCRANDGFTCDNEEGFQVSGRLGLAALIFGGLGQLCLLSYLFARNKVERSVLPLAYVALGFYFLDWFLLLASWVHLTNIFYSTASCIVESVARNGVVRDHATFHDMISEKGSYNYESLLVVGFSFLLLS